MSKELVMDDKIEMWDPALIAIQEGKEPTCPYCKNGDLNVTAKRISGDMGYILITCDKCNKTGYYSRVDLSKW